MVKPLLYELRDGVKFYVVNCGAGKLEGFVNQNQVISALY